jgi:hypothetical protein
MDTIQHNESFNSLSTSHNAPQSVVDAQNIAAAAQKSADEQETMQDDTMADAHIAGSHWDLIPIYNDDVEGLFGELTEPLYVVSPVALQEAVDESY